MLVKRQFGAVRRKFVSSMCKREAPLGTRGPIVSFTFDDFPRSALTAGGEILRSHGIRGTYYAAAGMMDTSNHLGEQFRAGDLDKLLRDGHELASHTFSHLSCRSISVERFRRDVERGRRELEKITGQSDSGNFAFPFGQITLNAKRAVGQDVASSRGIMSGFNGPVIDLNMLRANSLYGDRSNHAKVRDLIVENERRQSWLIFYTHDVSPTPSPYGCTPELLEFAVSFASQSCAQVSTIAEALSETGPRVMVQSHGVSASCKDVLVGSGISRLFHSTRVQKKGTKARW
jgi:peptidoglycan/xylan/chitin deacetylase (PgdA/CDA1 family)